MFYILSKTLDFFATPLAWAFVLCLWGGLSRSRHARFAPLIAAAVLYLFSIQPVAHALASHLESSAKRTVRDDVTYDTVILLGGVVDYRATPVGGPPSYNDNVERLLVTFDLLRTNRARTAIVSGGIGSARDPIVEARVLAKQLRDWGIEPGRVIEEPKARNTRENAVESGRIVADRGFHDVLVVTSAFHMARALACFRAVGLSPDALPVDFKAERPDVSLSFVPNAGALYETSHALRELVGQLVYRVVGYGKD